MSFENSRIEKIAKITKIAKILQEHHIVGIGVSYSGSNDSGCLDDVWVLEEIESIDENFGYDPRRNKAKEDLLSAMPVPQDIDKHSRDNLLAYTGELLADMAPDGWENNDGGEGTVLLDVSTEEVTVRHGYFRTEIDYDTYSYSAQEEE